MHVVYSVRTLLVGHTCFTCGDRIYTCRAPHGFITNIPQMGLATKNQQILFVWIISGFIHSQGSRRRSPDLNQVMYRSSTKKHWLCWSLQLHCWLNSVAEWVSVWVEQTKSFDLRALKEVIQLSFSYFSLIFLPVKTIVRDESCVSFNSIWPLVGMSQDHFWQPLDRPLNMLYFSTQNN